MDDVSLARAPATKEQLEIAKLQLEVRYIKRNFLLQFTNTALLAFVALLGLYFVQLPQLDNLAATRQFLEQQQIDNSVLSYLNMKDGEEKKVYYLP